MPYCPKCRDEFQDWVKVCPHCDVALVDKLPSAPKQEEHDAPLLHIATAPSEQVAYMWAGILADHGIRCLVKAGDLRAVGYVFSYNLGDEIHVLASQAERAAQILVALLEDNQAPHTEER